MNLGNTTLIGHGIQNEQADLRFHVSVVTKSVYIFEPKFAMKQIATGKYRDAFAYTGNIKTARGYLIPPDHIYGCRRVEIPDDILQEAHFNSKGSTTEKGKKAVLVVRKMMRRGLLSIVLDTVDVDDRELQIDGYDIIPIYSESQQIKCDWNAGDKQLGGTGNLYIQVAECNPLRQY